MAQNQVRFTSIFLFTILGGSIIHILMNGIQSFRISRNELAKILPLQFLALLPLIHFIGSGKCERELVLLAPLFVIPIIFCWLKTVFPLNIGRLLSFSLSAAFVVLLVLLLLENPVVVWNSVRSEEGVPGLFILARPQMGLLVGLMFFIISHLLELRKRPILFFIFFSVFALILFWILAKMAMIAFLLTNLILLLIDLRRKPVFLIAFLFICFSFLLAGISKLSDSGIVQEAFQQNGLSFEKYPKVLVNSLNIRLALWRSYFDILGEKEVFLTGIPPEDQVKEMQRAIVRYGPYLASKDFNCHNQELYLLASYGIWGLLFFVWFWFNNFFKTGSSSFAAGLWIFFFLCSQTEIYLDREFGSQILMLMVFLNMGLFSDSEKRIQLQNG